MSNQQVDSWLLREFKWIFIQFTIVYTLTRLIFETSVYNRFIVEQYLRTGTPGGGEVEFSLEKFYMTHEKKVSKIIKYTEREVL